MNLETLCGPTFLILWHFLEVFSISVRISVEFLYFFVISSQMFTNSVTHRSELHIKCGDVFSVAFYLGRW